MTLNMFWCEGNVPPKADLGQLQGLEALASGTADVPMINGGNFDGAKAYKDSKVRIWSQHISWQCLSHILQAG